MEWSKKKLNSKQILFEIQIKYKLSQGRYIQSFLKTWDGNKWVNRNRKTIKRKKHTARADS